MNKDSPSAETSIASQKLDSASGAKASHAKLRKRPEDEVAADPRVAAATGDQAPADQQAQTGEQVLIAQAAGGAAAVGPESTGGGAPAAAAQGSAAPAEGSASAGAGAAGAGGGISVGGLALGAGALGLAAAAVGASGGGGGGGGSPTTPSAPAPTPATPPAPTPVVVHSFGEYMAAVNHGGATAATNATGSLRPDGTVNVDISGGVSRSVLPKTLADLQPMTYNVSNASAATINDGGIVVDLQGNPDARVTAHSDAAAGASNLMWLQTLAVRDQASPGETHATATAAATATGSGSDGEIGVQHLSMALAGSGALNGRTDLAATATDGGSAHTLVGDVTLGVASSGTGTSAAPVSTQIHMGFGEGDVAGILASATGAGSSANVGVTGNMSLSAHGDDVYAFNSGIFSQGMNGGSAHTDIGGNLSFASDGREAHSYILVDASTDGAAGSAADVHIHGNVDLQSTGTEWALTRAAVRADGTGTVEIDGHLSAHSMGPTVGASFMQVSAQGGDVGIGAVDMNMDNVGGRGWMDLYTDHSGGLSIGAVDLSATAGSEINLHVQNANDAVNGVVDGTFVAHTDGTAAVSIGTANLAGGGDVHMFLNSQSFGTINQGASLARLDVHYQLADQDAAGIGAAPMTTINGFTGSHDDVSYNGVLADATNFSSAGSFDSLTALNAGLDAALDGTHKYVFAVYNGTEDINRNGVADDHGSGVLAWDDNGAGVTSVLMLPGVTTLTPNDLS